MKHLGWRSRTSVLFEVALLAACLPACGGGGEAPQSAASQRHTDVITVDGEAQGAADGRAEALAVAQATGPVCFFEHTEYRGASFCTEADSAWVGAAWNDRISSVRVPAGTQVELFWDVNYAGRALTLSGDAPNLVSLNFNDAASSFRVRGSGGGCNAVTWTRGVNYGLGTIVLFPPNGQYYKLVNVGTNGSDGTDPTISTWYWQPTTCGGGGGGGGGGSGFIVSEALFNQMFPSRIAFYNYQGLIAALGAYSAFATSGGDTVRRQEAAAFLANIDHESGGLRYVRELNTANWNSYCSSGNCGGRQYYGRGPIQLSWDYNYRTAGDALGIDLLGNPDLVATDSAVAWKTAIWYWMTQRAQAARTPHDAMVQGAGFGETIRAINGGIECNASGLGNQQMRARVDKYLEFTRLLGVPAGNNLTC
jgi:predicted chitinase